MLVLRDYFHFTVILGAACVVPVDSQQSEDDVWADVLPYIITAAVIIVVLFCIIVVMFLAVCVMRWKQQQRLNIIQSYDHGNLDLCYENTAVTGQEMLRDSVDQIKVSTEYDHDDANKSSVSTKIDVCHNATSAGAQVTAAKNGAQHVTDANVYEKLTIETVDGIQAHTYEVPDHSRKHSYSDYVIENPFTDDKLSILKMTVDQKAKLKPRSSHLVTINIPCDDNEVPTLVEDQGNSDDALVIENSITTAATHSADDIKEIVASNNEQLQSSPPATQALPSSKNPDEISDDTDYVIESLCSNDVSSSASNHPDNRSKHPVSQKVAPKPSCMVAINIPHDDSGAPTLAKNIGTYDQCTASEGCDEVAAYITIGETSASDKTIELQKNPAYNIIHHSSSGVHSYEEISYSTANITNTNSSSTNDTTIEMEKNPAYHTVKHAEPTLQKRLT